MDIKLEFAQRLRDAMVAAGLEPRPGVLCNLFNARYWGRSVSFQAVSRWLRGQAIPEQDKLLVLAEILNVPPEVLRFGEAARLSVQQRQLRWEQGAGYLERETFDAFLQLPAPQRKLIRETILLFRKANEVEGNNDRGRTSADGRA
jgi:transcriptional regulator with XRE-family HTH domain